MKTYFIIMLKEQTQTMYEPIRIALFHEFDSILALPDFTECQVIFDQAEHKMTEDNLMHIYSKNVKIFTKDPLTRKYVIGEMINRGFKLITDVIETTMSNGKIHKTYDRLIFTI
jgi:hypothetical protein